ncbi:hypothetical protein [Nocardia sp. NPDC050412]|uniref:hypothetical protein n=1 Tax=Nocardia sp. NPDC050412 TaxID=3364320 RepID=UPI0037AD107C
MRWSKARESEPKPGAGIDERVAWLEKLARSSQDMVKAQNELIEAQGAMIKALLERGDEHANRLESIDPLITAQGNMIDALVNQADGHHDVILELNDRVAKLEAQAAQAQGEDS